VPVRFSVAEEQGAVWTVSYLSIARLKAGVTLRSARAELDSSMPRFLPPGMPGRYWTIVQPLQSALVGETGSALWLLLFAVAFLLVIACVNVANLSLVRTVQRARELGIRVALGASRRDLIAYSFTESLLLSLAGTAIGIIASMWITEAVISLAPARIPRLDEVSIDATIGVFSVVVCILTTVLFGIFPAWRASHTDPQQTLSAVNRGNTDSLYSGQIRSALVSAEVALGTMLAIGSGLLLNSLHHMMTTPKGFVADNVLFADFTLPSSKYRTVAARRRFFNDLRNQLSGSPGVTCIAASSIMPLEAERLAPAVIQESDVFNAGPVVTWPIVSSEYLAALGIPRRDGRFFREDEPDEVAVVSESAARLLWPGENPIGKKISFPQSPRKWLRVVGVAGDVLSAGLDRAPTPAIYRPYSQFAGSTFRLVAQTAVIPSAFHKTLLDAVNAVDAEIPVADVRTMSELIGKSARERQFQAGLLTVFAFAAVLLAAIGIYGVVANGMQQRRKEIGVRIALGANRRNVMRLVFRNGMAPVLLGLSAGVVMSMLLARLIASLLFQVGTLDLITFCGAPLVLASAGALPCWLVARQSCRIDPAVCLRID
jgi:putative ABC transport system permease protein